MRGYQSGLSATRTAAGVGPSKRAALTVLHDQRTDLRLQELTAVEIEVSVARYVTGLSIVQISNELGRAPSSIQTVLVRAGVAMRSKTRPTKLTTDQVKAACLAPGWRFPS